MSLLIFWPAGAPAAFVLSASANVTASGQATTAQLTAPAGKTSGADFQAGRLQDDENPADAIDLASGKYTELEWSIKAVGSQVTASDVYEFRIVADDVPLDTYTETPQGTIATSGINGVLSQPLGALTLTSTGAVDIAGTASVTLGAVTSAATGTVDIVGTSSVTLGALTLASVGTVEARADLAVTLGALTVTSTGTVDVIGVLAQTLGALTLEATNVALRFGLESNPAGNVTWDDAAYRQAIQRGNIAGVDYQRLTFTWANLEPTEGVYDLTALQRLVDESPGMPLWLNLKVLDYTALKTLPAYLDGLALDSVTVKDAYNELLDAVAAVAPNVWGISLGSEVDHYLGLAENLDEITPFANLLASAKTHAQSLWGSTVEVVAIFSKSATASSGAWAIYAAIHAVATTATFTYYFINPDLSLRDTNPATMASTLGDDLFAIYTNIGSVPFIIEEFGVPSSTALGSSEQLQLDALNASYDVFHVFGVDNAFLKAVTWLWMNEFSDALLDALGFTGAARDYVGSLGLRRQNNTPKPAWPELVERLGGQEVFFGDLAGTLSTLTLSSAATVEVQGTSSPTLGALTLQSDGVVGDAPLTGDLTQTLGALTLASTGTVEIQGAATPTLGALTLSSAGGVEVQGTASPTLGTLTVTAAGTADIAGVLAQTLGVLTSTATGAVDVAGALSQTLGAVTSLSEGVVGDPPNAGELIGTLGTLTASSTGQVEVSGVAVPTLGALTLVSVAVTEIAGAAEVTFGPVTSSSAGTVALSGQAAITLDELYGLLTAGVEVQGVLSVTLGTLGVEPEVAWQPVSRPGQRYGSRFSTGTRNSTVLTSSVTETDVHELVEA